MNLNTDQFANYDLLCELFEKKLHDYFKPDFVPALVDYYCNGISMLALKKKYGEAFGNEIMRMHYKHSKIAKVFKDVKREVQKNYDDYIL